MSDVLKVRVVSKTLICQLNRPKFRNALNLELVNELQENLNAFSSDANIRAVVISGAPPVFCAGGDLFDAGDDLQPSAIVQRHKEFIALALSISRYPKPIVSSVNGAAVGAGAALALLCDYVVLGSSATFSFPFTRIGLPPDFLTASELVRRAGSTVARDLIYRGESISAVKAQSLKLADEVCDDDKTEEIALFHAKRLGDISSFAFSLAKDAIRNSLVVGDFISDVEPLAVAAAAASDDFKTAVKRFRKTQGS